MVPKDLEPSCLSVKLWHVIGVKAPSGHVIDSETCTSPTELLDEGGVCTCALTQRRKQPYRVLLAADKGKPVAIINSWRGSVSSYTEPGCSIQKVRVWELMPHVL